VATALLDGSVPRGAFFRYRTLVRNLVAKDITVKYRGSLLGLLWSLLHPALMLVVYTFAFKVVLRVHTENYAYFIMAGLLPWTFFASALKDSTQAIVGNAGMIRRVYFPREILPIASVLFNFTQLLLALAVFLPALLLVSGVNPSWRMTLVVPLLLLHLAFTIGVALALASVTVHFRDVAHLTDVLLPLLFWATPIIYPIEMVP
jgi:homopolymeric O-antigen transport system permease protein